ncbi:transposase, partial [Gordonia amicalis]|uniref:transposase n=1 Tax=Gordonia amicalis TaxID=89053 RepID=UPI0022B5416B
EEGAKFWAGVCANLANRGVKDVLIVCCDGLTGFPEAIEATWPLATVQTCVVHLIRNSMRFVNYKDRKDVARAIKPIYTAPDAETARREWEAFRDSELGVKNSIESLNYQLRKVIKNRGHFPNDIAVR